MMSYLVDDKLIMYNCSNCIHSPSRIDLIPLTYLFTLLFVCFWSYMS